MELFVTYVSSFQPLSNITTNCILGVSGVLDPVLASCEFLLILGAGLGGKTGICIGLLSIWFEFLYFSNGVFVKSIIGKNDTDSESNKEYTQTQSYFYQVLDLLAFSKSSHYRNYLEVLNDNVNTNELESIVNNDKESSNAPNDIKTSNNNVKNSNNNKRKANVNIDKNDSKKSKRWIWTSEMFETLLLNIVEYKSKKEFEGVNFEADMIAFYSRLREMMAEMFLPTDFEP